MATMSTYDQDGMYISIFRSFDSMPTYISLLLAKTLTSFVRSGLVSG